MKIIRPNSDSLIVKDLTESQIDSLIHIFTSQSWNAEYDLPEYPIWNNWSDSIPLNVAGKYINKEVLREFKKTGVYKIFYKDETIYIGETRSVTRNGMLARRSDFLSTIKGGDKIKNPYGNGTKFLENFCLDDIKYVSHRFHVVHPIYCKDAELEQLQIFYDENEKLPLLQTEWDYNRITKSNLSSFF